MLGFLGLFGLAMGGLVYMQNDTEDDDQTVSGTAADDTSQMAGLDQMLDASGTDVLAMVQVDETAGDDADGGDYVPLDDGTQNDPRWIAIARTQGTDDDDILSGEETSDTMDGGTGDDTITGKGGSDSLSGGDGSDRINAGQGNDTVSGDAGDDILEGGWGNDTLTGGEGRDTMFGGHGDDLMNGADDDGAQDFINGGDGDDTLIAGQDDILHGGDGSDLFVMNVGAGATISDYNAAHDTIELTYDDTPPELSTQTDDDGLTLFADGAPAARLLGVTELDLDTVVLTPAA
ncbi:hypothetical protein LGQ03_08995 [Loktanella sp. TSTF-M6]|uniref:Hemolysin type calcium-binding protein n=1 Tax=Loktanella gaetbuli TaxID=2881335 RepID=A0ABS8BUF4_9RHOB|nr:calcium-binding protein [Loktanella gaetbuli]MCB5199377.1 hypothetical protein [Loktanella gaetbuli]